MYEYATEEQQRYKEGKVILERALIAEINGIDEIWTMKYSSHYLVLVLERSVTYTSSKVSFI